MAPPRRFNPETFKEWINSPLTQVYLTFLLDRRRVLADLWMQGQSLPPEAQYQATFLGELSALEWANYAEFYGLEDEADQDQSAGD